LGNVASSAPKIFVRCGSSVAATGAAGGCTAVWLWAQTGVGIKKKPIKTGIKMCFMSSGLPENRGKAKPQMELV
jgi:hypothetical protein